KVIVPFQFAILVTQLKYLVSAYAEDTNKLWTIDVTAKIAIIIIMLLSNNFTWCLVHLNFSPLPYLVTGWDF
ncbi:MAG: hypothetical protein WBP84_10915, partial [Nitrososphaeraceae archaeon]